MTLKGAFDGIGDDFSRYQRVMHTHVIHGDAVTDTDRGDLERHATGHVDTGLDGIRDAVEVTVTGDDVVLGIDDGDEWTLQLLVRDTVSLQ